jgi:hypothetical protein
MSLLYSLDVPLVNKPCDIPCRAHVAVSYCILPQMLQEVYIPRIKSPQRNASTVSEGLPFLVHCQLLRVVFLFIIFYRLGSRTLAYQPAALLIVSVALTGAQ